MYFRWQSGANKIIHICWSLTDAISGFQIPDRGVAFVIFPAGF